MSPHLSSLSVGSTDIPTAVFQSRPEKPLLLPSGSNLTVSRNKASSPSMLMATKSTSRRVWRSLNTKSGFEVDDSIPWTHSSSSRQKKVAVGLHDISRAIIFRRVHDAPQRHTNIVCCVRVLKISIRTDSVKNNIPSVLRQMGQSADSLSGSCRFSVPTETGKSHEGRQSITRDAWTHCS
mmetsp:Transcript_11561/g.21329  ORF Transcript_11561/g.21329 Transcript_11561/m.21329 type:complete len:180 (+) Transcript_11561:360-899(+)